MLATKLLTSLYIREDKSAHLSLTNVKNNDLSIIFEISRLFLAPVGEQACLSITWSETPKINFLATEPDYSCKI